MTKLERIEQVTELLNSGLVSRQYAVDRIREIESMADVPAAAPLAADTCKAPECCGLNYSDPKVPHFSLDDDTQGRIADTLHFPGVACFCSTACHESALARLPPLAAQSAETKRFIAIDPAVPGSERTAHRCTGCDWWIDSTCMAEEDVTRLVHEHLAKDHACKPAPQPAPAKLECDVRDEEIPCGGALLKRIFSHDLPPGMLCDAHYLLRETRFEVSREQSTGILRNPAVPERLERPKLAHSSMWADEAEDVS